MNYEIDKEFDTSMKELSTGVDCGRLRIKVAQNSEELQAVLKLRFKIFNEELGEGIPENAQLGLDLDEFDRYCDHLMVIDTTRLHEGLENSVIGTYRILFGPKRPANGYYTQTEYDISALKIDPKLTIELGRGCIATEYRKQSTLLTLFWGVHRYILAREARYLIGCASLPPMGPNDAMATFENVRGIGRALELANPHPQNSFTGDATQGVCQIPPLLNLYLEFGALILGKPAYDPIFRCYDVPVFFDHDKMTGWGRELLSRFDKRMTLSTFTPEIAQVV